MFKTLTRRLVGVGAAAAMAFGGVVVLQEPAVAAGCYISSCTNKEPTAQGCATGATTVTETPWNSTVSGDWMVDMRRSTTCGSRWARIQISYCWCSDQVVRARIERRWREYSTDPWIYSHTYYKEPPGDGTYWTNMVPDNPASAQGGEQFRVCWEKKLIGTSWPGVLGCSSWVS